MKPDWVAFRLAVCLHRVDVELDRLGGLRERSQCAFHPASYQRPPKVLITVPSGAPISPQPAAREGRCLLRCSMGCWPSGLRPRRHPGSAYPGSWHLLPRGGPSCRTACCFRRRTEQRRASRRCSNHPGSTGRSRHCRTTVGIQLRAELVDPALLREQGTSNIPVVTTSKVAAPVETSVVTLDLISFSGRMRRLSVIPVGSTRTRP